MGWGFMVCGGAVAYTAPAHALGWWDFDGGVSVGGALGGGLGAGGGGNLGGGVLGSERE